MSDLGHEPPIIRIVKKINHAGHHGGAWKVAFADFMTAMMALFIVLWILNQSEDIKRGVGGYFRDPMGKAAMGRGPDQENAGKVNILGPKMIATPEIFKRMAASQADLETQADHLKEMLKKEEGLAALGDQISIEVTKEGIRIEIADNDEGTIFDLGSANLKPRLIRALEILGKEYSKLPSPVVIEGHTDSTPYGSGSGMSNWELSTQRANEARKVLESAGLQSEKIFMIRGYADRRPISANSAEARNRRISMLLLSSQGLEMSFGTMNFHEAEAPYIDSGTTPPAEPITVATRGKP
jgi:chemotaxis protein MotB